MCLESVNYKKGEAWGTGYKVFVKHHKGLIGFIFGGPYRVHEWITDNINCDIGYPIGFHIYLREEDAMSEAKYYGNDHVVHKVLFEDIVAIGTQDKRPVVVVKRMKIEDELT